MAKLVSKTYGDALFELAVEENRLDEFVEEVSSLIDILKENDELTKLLNHPKISKQEKAQVVEEIFGGKISRELLGLMNMIVQKDRNNEMIGIFEYFVAEVKEYKNIGTAYVTTAVELSDVQKSQIEKRLLETTKYVKIDINYAIVPDETGQVVDDTIDGLVNGKINVFSGSFTGVNPYDENDRIDLSTPFIENEKSSSPAFCYVLDDVITVLP